MLTNNQKELVAHRKDVGRNGGKNMNSRNSGDSHIKMVPIF